MRKKLLKKSAVCVLASVCMLSQSFGADASSLSGWKEVNGAWKHYNESGQPRVCQYEKRQYHADD